jgi:large subunit ribosomal protein L32
MPLPKRRHSKTRRDKRRGQDKIKCKILVQCKKTNVLHEPHKAYIAADDLMYKGNILIKDFKK